MKPANAGRAALRRPGRLLLVLALLTLPAGACCGGPWGDPNYNAHYDALHHLRGPARAPGEPPWRNEPCFPVGDPYYD